MKPILILCAAAALFCIPGSNAVAQSGTLVLANQNDTPFHHWWARNRSSQSPKAIQHRIVPSPTINAEDASFIGTGDQSAGYWGHP